MKNEEQKSQEVKYTCNYCGVDFPKRAGMKTIFSLICDDCKKTGNKKPIFPFVDYSYIKLDQYEQEKEKEVLD